MEDISNTKSPQTDEKALVIRPEAGALTTLETLIKGSVKVHGNLLIQAFLSPVYKKGILYLLTLKNR